MFRKLRLLPASCPAASKKMGAPMDPTWCWLQAWQLHWAKTTLHLACCQDPAQTVVTQDTQVNCPSLPPQCGSVPQVPTPQESLSDLVGLVAKDQRCPGTSAANATTKPTTGASRATVQAASTSLSFLIDSGFQLTLVKRICLRYLWCALKAGPTSLGLQVLTSVPSGPPDCSSPPNCPFPLLYRDSVAKFSFSTNSFLNFFFLFPTSEEPPCPLADSNASPSLLLDSLVDPRVWGALLPPCLPITLPLRSCSDPTCYPVSLNTITL